jgi:hypothetical protein
VRSVCRWRLKLQQLGLQQGYGEKLLLAVVHMGVWLSGVCSCMRSRGTMEIDGCVAAVVRPRRSVSGRVCCQRLHVAG